MLQCEWTLCSSYIREACIFKKAKEKHCTPSSLLPQYVSKSFTAAWLIRFMNEPDDITLIQVTSGWWNNTEITCHSLTVQYWMLRLKKTVQYYHPKQGDSPQTLLQNCILQCHWLTQIFKSSCLHAPFFSCKSRGRWGEENTVGKPFIYLPVSPFEHHSKGSVSNQVFSAVLKISHSLHCDGLLVQLMLGAGGQPWMLLSSSKKKKSRSKWSTQSWWCCFLHCGFISWQAALMCLIA